MADKDWWHIEKLTMQTEIDRLRSMYQKSDTENNELRTENERMTVTNERLRAALQFYADKKSWMTKGHPQIDAYDTPINHDNGELARKTLNEQITK